MRQVSVPQDFLAFKKQLCKKEKAVGQRGLGRGRGRRLCSINLQEAEKAWNVSQSYLTRDGFSRTISMCPPESPSVRPCQVSESLEVREQSGCARGLWSQAA